MGSVAISPPSFLYAVFRRAEAALDLPVRPAQGLFRIDSEPAADLGDREQQVAQLFGHAAFVAAPDLVAQFAEFLRHLADDRRGVRPVEAGPGHAPAQLVGTEEGGEGGRHVVQNARGFKPAWPDFRDFSFLSRALCSSQAADWASTEATRSSPNT